MAEAGRLAVLLGRGGSVYSRLDLHDASCCGTTSFIRSGRWADALRWELGDRAASALRCW